MLDHDCVISATFFVDSYSVLLIRYMKLVDDKEEHFRLQVANLLNEIESEKFRVQAEVHNVKESVAIEVQELKV